MKTTFTFSCFPVPLAAFGFALSLLASVQTARADDEDGPADDGPFELGLAGYGEVEAAVYDYGPDPTRPGGAAPDRRLELKRSRYLTPAGCRRCRRSEQTTSLKTPGSGPSCSIAGSHAGVLRS